MAKPLNTAEIGVALIGAGMIAPTHIAALSALRPRLGLRAIVSQRPERAMHYASQYAGPAPLFTADLAQVTDDPTIKMAIVATPPSVRIDLITALAQSGTHILLEKPVARTLDEAQQVVDICNRAGVTLGVLFQHRMRAPSLAAARLIADGNLGKLGHVEIAAPLWRDQSYYDELGRGTYARDGGGVLLTQAIHTIDLALSLTGPAAGPVTTVRAMTATSPLHQMEAEDFAVAGLTFANGAVGSLVASTASFPQRPETITLHFEHASLRVGTSDLNLMWRDGRPCADAQITGTATDTGPTIAKHEWHQAVIDDFATALRNNRPPLVSGQTALAAHQLITAIETSSRTGQPVTLSPPQG
ncbi:Gfo/Idh/MocA family protein [Pseudorhodobacter wandonensis]|uniref:Gfo/Idh/MocA family protein n=1 Tax=Pseudorhodobacter wandonensis TaxID=1120568 RepID=UPI00067DB8E9|nr:Gfo/Idh/MocA family oxidoreductase [Pseudorhodobacter wandonensis]